ncbi:MAG: CHAP domain-containing protein [Acidimicrobiales bacterium]|nr:CHAP domain-containing protein [Acidimicrobiales bacterium]
MRRMLAAVGLLAMVLAVPGLASAAGHAQAVVAQEPQSSEVAPVEAGDDYPEPWRSAAQDSLVDSWGYYNRECTSFVAWALHSRNGYEMPRAIGNANNWDNYFSSHGVTVNSTPAVGAIAQTDAGVAGHVAWVFSVGSGTVTVEEYNYSVTGRYGTRTVPTSSFRYIHVKDLGSPTPPPPASTSSVAAGRNGDGRLELFAVHRNGRMFNNFQRRASAGPWAGWGSLGGSFTTSVTLATNKDGRLEIFAVGLDGAVYNKWQTRPGAGPWSAWNRLGGTFRPSLAVTRNRDGRLEVFAVGTDRYVYNNYQRTAGGAWQGWSNSASGRTFRARAVAATTNKDGRVEIFAVDLNNRVENNYQRRAGGGGWQGWGVLPGGRFAAAITAARNNDGRLEIFALTPEGRVLNNYQRTAGGTWSGWTANAAGDPFRAKTP